MSVLQEMLTNNEQLQRDAAELIANFAGFRPRVRSIIEFIKSRLEPLANVVHVDYELDRRGLVSRGHSTAWWLIPKELPTAPFVELPKGFSYDSPYYSEPESFVHFDKTTARLWMDDYTSMTINYVLDSARSHAQRFHDTRGLEYLRIASSRKQAQLATLLSDFDEIRSSYHELAQIIKKFNIALSKVNFIFPANIRRLNEAIALSFLAEREAETKRFATERAAFQRARLAAMDEETRSLTERFKGKIEFDGRCIYCECSIVRGQNAHLDHINPVSKGGLATPENLAWACDTCNLAKRDHGLMQFLRAGGFKTDDVVDRLHRLGKFV